VAVAATGAVAGGALKLRRAEVPVAPGDTESATATCPKGFRAVSGGFKAPDPTNLRISSRSGRRGWTSMANVVPSSPDSGTVAALAYGSDELPKLKTRSATTDDIPYGPTGTVSARCPKGQEAVSGGFEAPASGTGFNQVHTIGSRRIGKRTWQVTGQGAANSEHRLNAFVYCSKDKVGLKARVASASALGELTKKARCKKGQEAISGGFEASIAGGNFVDPRESRRAGRRGWAATMTSEDEAGSVDLDVYAYCLEKEQKG
jgi:hypothetical protein